jgi:nucleotide-binding universal stress UspA family protein
MDIRNVLVPVDFSSASARELALAIEVCRAFGARLVLHHNQDGAPLGLSRAWDWEEQHPRTQGRGRTVERNLYQLMAQVPEDVAVESVISRGLVTQCILALAERIPADLVVVASHGPDSEDHSSVAERLIGGSPCPVLTVQEGTSGERSLRLLGSNGIAPEVLVPTDLEKGSQAVLDYAFALARRLPLRLRLFHVTGGDPEAALARLCALVPADLAARVRCEAQPGAAADAIVSGCERACADFVIMGEHARGLRGLLTHDTARDLLRQAPCPVWYVPPRLAA